MTYHEPTQELPVQKTESICGVPCGRGRLAKRTARLVVLCICTLISTASSKTKTIAFPGAEGAGKFTKGGRGGDLYHVTNLKDSGSGSLREGIESIKGPGTIVFDVAGTIRLKDKLVIQDKSYLTIAGQTAPGKGITLADQSLQIKECKHIIVRYLRVRLGDENKPAGSGPDCITVDYCDHIILDHLSLSWGIDGNGDFRGLKRVILQWIHDEAPELFVVCGDRHWQYVSVHPETGVREYSCGSTTDKHAGGWSRGFIEEYHR